jgi:hypothetical protein
MIDKIEGDYKKGKFLTESPVNEDCWQGYKQVGGKMKNGKMVPNCVPTNKSIKSEYASNQTLSYLPADEEEIEKMNETMIRRAGEIVKQLVPKDTLSRFASDGQKNAEFVKNVVRDLTQSLNRFYKNHDISVRIKENEEDSNVDMVLGVLSILRQIDDKENRKRVAVDMIKKFKEQDIDFDYQEFIDLMKEQSIQPGSKKYFNPKMTDDEIIEFSKQLSSFPHSRLKMPGKEIYHFVSDIASVLGLPKEPTDLISYRGGSGYYDETKIKMDKSKARLFKMYKDGKLSMSEYGDIQKKLLEKYKSTMKKMIAYMHSRY